MGSFRVAEVAKIRRMAGDVRARGAGLAFERSIGKVEQGREGNSTAEDSDSRKLKHCNEIR